MSGQLQTYLWLRSQFNDSVEFYDINHWRLHNSDAYRGCVSAHLLLTISDRSHGGTRIAYCIIAFFKVLQFPKSKYF